MNKAEFTDLIINPDKLGSEHIDTLKKIVADYPFFSTAHILLAKALLNTKHYEYEKQLKITALSVGNRAVLHQFLNNNLLEEEEENSLMRVPTELKAEKVSKPDFEIGKEEQEALLNEAQNIISNNDNITNEPILDSSIENLIPEDYSENFEEILAEKAEKEIDTNQFLEPILTDNTAEFEVQNSLENKPDVIENIIETASDNFNYSEPILENIVAEIPVTEKPIENLTTENTTELHENNSEIDFHLAETEGELVRFVNDSFLPNFDETSLLIDDLEIETITKSVLPSGINITNDLATKNNEEILVEEPEKIIAEEPENKLATDSKIDEINILEEEDLKQEEIQELNALEQIAPITELTNEVEINQADDIVVETKIDLEAETELDELDELNTVNPIDELPNDSFTLHPTEIIEHELPIILEENVPETDKILLENLLADEPTELEETVQLEEEDIIKENTLEKEFEPIILAENSDVNLISNINKLNFFDWLNQNKTNNDEVEILVTNKLKTYEDIDFVDKIKQIIKTKAEAELNKKITIEIEHANHLIPSFERKKIIPELIDESVETMEKADNLLEEIMMETAVDNEMEQHEISTEETTFLNANTFVNSEIDIEFKEPESHVHSEFYSGEVESILPDFEALNAKISSDTYLKFDKKDGLIPNYETATFDPLFNNEVQITNNNLDKQKPIINEEQEINEPINFESTPIDENIFIDSFNEIYVPLEEKTTNIETENTKSVEPQIESPKSEIENILDKFMRENPSISRPKTEFFNPANVAKISVEEKDEIVSETLATIYLKQGLIKKAISTYEKLCLIYPHKNAYFAALINQLKTEHNIN